MQDLTAEQKAAWEKEKAFLKNRADALDRACEYDTGEWGPCKGIPVERYLRGGVERYCCPGHLKDAFNDPENRF